MHNLAWILVVGGMVLSVVALWMTWRREDEFTMAYHRGEALDVLEEIWIRHHQEDEDADNHEQPAG